MKQLYRFFFLLILFSVILISCVAKKKRNETSKLGKAYQNTTAYYNGYWNAKEILRESMITLRLANVDDYNKILEVEDFVSVDNPKMVKAEMDKIIEKVTTVAQLHEPSDWVDDCYVMMAKAQYLKQEYETAEETLQYFQEDFNPSNPYGRNYKSKKPTGKAAKKIKEEERKEAEKKKEKEREEKKEVKEEKAKTQAQERKEKKEAQERERKEKEKERERLKKEREKQKKKGGKGKKATTTKTEPTTKSDTIAKTNVEKPVSTKPATDKELTENKEAEEEYIPPVPKKPEEDKTAYSEGILWLAKTYIKRENWYASEVLLRKLEEGALSDDMKAEVTATYANLFIKQGKYSEALPKLKEAIENTSNKQLKARYAFIAGQLSQLLNDNSAAMEYFAASNDYAKDPKMEFMADLAASKNGLITGKLSKEQVVESLKKMLAQDKNANVKDQIYFTLAEIELSQNNITAAVDYFKSSIANNASDQKLKAEAYYSIATVYYGQEKYMQASNYFDTTMTFLKGTDPRFAQVQKYVTNLKDIAFNINIINTQDTLLYFAAMSEEDQAKNIPPYLKRNRNIAAPAAPTKGPISKQMTISNSVDFGNSSFFAYNKLAKNRGKEEFTKAWGTRKLEDDWRRSSKAIGDNTAEAEEEKKVKESDGLEQAADKEEYDAFVKTLPSNPIKKQEVNDKITLAMFTLGKLFRDKIENFKKSAETLDGMHTRFGATPYELDSYYYLYLDYLDLNNTAKAEEYKNKIIQKYPDSKYASILNDPNFYAKNKNKASKQDEYYAKVYSLFEKGQYPQALDLIEKSANTMVENNPHLAKISLIRAMCIGNRDGKDEYVKELNNVIISYPNTPEQTKAKEIMRFLGGDKNAFAQANIQDVDKIYQKDDTEGHYVTVITYDMEETKHINVKVAVSDYNKKNFKVERLQLGDASLNIEDNSQVILIRKFDNAAKAMEYYNKVIKDKDEYLGQPNLNVDIYAISQRNYRKMLSERSAVGYALFFQNKYLDIK
ncbi:MAG TPA: tetratricopeptide repeat protein [Saprospiraceae bacterium]|nr:tetratricopeptide repeat protein [Saprospiraceae bacterium]